MADNKRESSSLKNLLETVYEVHRKDIKTYTSGHLNSSKLLKPPEARHKRWETADKPPIRYGTGFAHYINKKWVYYLYVVVAAFLSVFSVWSCVFFPLSLRYDLRAIFRIYIFRVYCSLKPPCRLIDLPVRKGELSATDLRHKTMADRLVEFSLGPVRNLALSKLSIKYTLRIYILYIVNCLTRRCF